MIKIEVKMNKKKRVIIFGAGTLGLDIYEKISETCDVICYWDNRKTGFLNGIPIISPDANVAFDIVYLASCHEEMKDQLLSMGIPESKIDCYFIEHPFVVRRNWLQNFSHLLSKLKVNGAVCEAGVYKGDFAKYINQFFPDDILYLFDTFEGFDPGDVIIEKTSGYSCAQSGQFGDTSIELVMQKMTNKHNVKIVKGYFPDSAIEQNVNDTFKFVNLDLDLYKPTIEGLRFFSDKMQKNGVILVHDYFTHYSGIEKAVHEFLSERNDLRLIPIGDEMSIAIIGF